MRGGHRRHVGGVLRGVGMFVIALGTARCAYYNGVYNARAAAERADAFRAQGMSDSAAVWFRRSAASAEEVLARHADSPWHSEALLLAGRGLALGAGADRAACGRASAHLTAFQSVGAVPPSDRWRAETALGVCELEGGRGHAAAERLDALAATNDSGVPPDVRRDATRWRARVAIASGEASLADSLLRRLDVRDARWDRIAAAQAARRWPLIEELLRQAAADLDLRPALFPVLTQAAENGEVALADRVIEAFDAADIARRDRTQLQLFAGSLAQVRGDTASARAAYARVIARHVPGSPSDSVLLGEAVVGQLRLDIAATLAARTDVDRAAPESRVLGARLRALVFAAASTVRGNAALERVAESVALFGVLTTTVDSSGAASYLAGEVARDQLNADALAVAIWRAIGDSLPAAPLAPRALYAAALLDPARAEATRATVLARYPESPMADLLRGASVGDLVAHRRDDALLEGRWDIARRAQGDTLRAWRMRGVLSEALPENPEDAR